MGEEWTALISFSVISILPVSPPLAQTTELHRERDHDAVGLHKLGDVSGASSCAYVGGEGDYHVPHGSTTSLKSTEGGAAGPWFMWQSQCLAQNEECTAPGDVSRTLFPL